MAEGVDRIAACWKDSVGLTTALRRSAGRAGRPKDIDTGVGLGGFGRCVRAGGLYRLTFSSRLGSKVQRCRYDGFGDSSSFGEHLADSTNMPRFEEGGEPNATGTVAFLIVVD